MPPPTDAASATLPLGAARHAGRASRLSTPQQICPFDEAGIAACPLNRPAPLATWHRSRVHCRYLQPSATPHGVVAVCTRPVDSTPAESRCA